MVWFHESLLSFPSYNAPTASISISIKSTWGPHPAPFQNSPGLHLLYSSAHILVSPTSGLCTPYFHHLECHFPVLQMACPFPYSSCNPGSPLWTPSLSPMSKGSPVTLSPTPFNFLSSTHIHPVLFLFANLFIACLLSQKGGHPRVGTWLVGFTSVKTVLATQRKLNK